ncbi:MAG: hypothetical protein WDN03_18660 [Rhizomicrobium sp.]
MRLTTWIIGIPAALVAIWIALANRQAAILSLDPFSQSAPALTVQMPLYLLLFLAVLAGVLLGGAAIGMRRMSQIGADLIDTAAARAKALLPARLRRTKTPAE